VALDIEGSNAGDDVLRGKFCCNLRFRADVEGTPGATVRCFRRGRAEVRPVYEPVRVESLRLPYELELDEKESSLGLIIRSSESSDEFIHRQGGPPYRAQSVSFRLAVSF
jgi:hypothetical protein